MRAGIVVTGAGPESGTPSQRWRGYRAVDRGVVLAQISDVLAAGDSMLEPAAVLTLVCEAMATHLSLANVVFFKRLAGQSRALAWSAPGISTASRMAAREQAWSSAAHLVDDRLLGAALDDADQVATASVCDPHLGLSALLHVESLRRLDRFDRAFVDEVLSRLLSLADDA